MNSKKLITIFLMFLIIISLFYIIYYSYDIYQKKKEQNLLNEISIDETVIEKQNVRKETNQELEIPQDIEETPIKTERMLKLETLKQENSDIIGWIEIENTNINYPVLQSTNNSYYMNHNYKKEYSSNGSVFLDKDYDWNIPSSNLLIYGHNMKNNTMFQDLLKYNSKEFYLQHPTIRFTTINEDANYEIIAAFPSRVYYKTDKNVFRYYFFVNATSEDDFNNFVSNSKNASLYDTGKTALFGEQLLTLSTCSYHTKNGRFAVVAKKVI